MDKQRGRVNRVWFCAAFGILFLGWIPAAKLFHLTWTSKMPQIIEVLRDPSQEARFPGAVDLELKREGAYAIHYFGQEGADVHGMWPPKLDCRLSESVSGRDIQLVPDYVPTNRHETDEGGVGVLIYSTTVQKPGMHTLSCDFAEGQLASNFSLVIGPNFVYEFLRLILPLGLGVSAALILGAAATASSSALLGVGLILQRKQPERC
jgi:hypothetical protein